MRFHTVVALSALTLGASVAAMPVLDARETFDYPAEFVRELEELEARGKGLAFLAGGPLGLVGYHFWKKHKANVAAKKAAAANGAPPEAPDAPPSRRELYWENVDARDLDDLAIRELFWENPEARSPVMDHATITAVLQHLHQHFGLPAGAPGAPAASGSGPESAHEESAHLAPHGDPCKKGTPNQQMRPAACAAHPGMVGYKANGRCNSRAETESLSSKLMGSCYFA